MAPNELFNGFERAEWKEEARRRWGHTEAYRQSQERAAGYIPEDWQQIQAQAQAIYSGLAGLMQRCPQDAQVQALVARHHQQINERFYACPLDIYRDLGDMYVDDPRFTANIDQTRPGLAAFLREAIHAFCDAPEGRQE